MPLKRAGPLVARPSKRAKVTLVRAPTVNEVQDSKIAKLSRQVKRLAKAQETNYKDVLINTNCAYDVNNAIHISSILNDGGSPTGTVGTRIGEKVSPYFLEIRGRVRQPLSAIENPSVVRMIIIQSKQRFTPSTISIPGANNVLANQNSIFAYLSPFDRDNRQHFTVLHDEMFSLTSWSTAGGTMTGEPGQHLVHIKKKLSKDIAFELSGSTPEAGNIYVCFFSSVAAANTEPVFEGFSRIYYKDG